MPWNISVTKFVTAILRCGFSWIASRRKEAKADPPPEVATQPVKEDNSPKTVFIFKDGHQIERKSAVVGQTLYDFSNTGLKKVQLADMDKEATTKANDDRGITRKLP